LLSEHPSNFLQNIWFCDAIETIISEKTGSSGKVIFTTWIISPPIGDVNENEIAAERSYMLREREGILAESAEGERERKLLPPPH